MSDMRRVSTKNPCPVCKKPDWCLIGKSVVMCMRVTSVRTKSLSDGSVGYLHRIDGVDYLPPLPKRQAPERVRDWPSLLAEWRARLGRDIPSLHCSKLGLPEAAMGLLGAQRAPFPETLAFPMRDGSNGIVGVRLRNVAGKKWAVTGSHQGLFIPQCDPQPVAYLVEGPTNTAAGLAMGVFCIGRPNNVGGIFDINALFKRLNIRKAVIVGDTDKDKSRPDGSKFNPGADGACALSEHLAIPHCTLLLPVKDMRDFRSNGGTAKMLNLLVDQCVWKRP